MNTHKELIIDALNDKKGDDLYRAKLAFRGMTKQQMQEQHGNSGQTREEIIAGYERWDAKIDEAIEWVRSQGD